MVKITISEFKKNFDKYMASLVKEEIILTQDGISIAKIVLPGKESIVSKLRGIIPNDDYSIEDARRERLSNQ
jgi:antitoxin (DNA-binding transcriptional repressor) of toxin-antitoxin stability system